jgi:hypothetical protein
MRLAVAAAMIFSLAAAPQQRGAVTSVTAEQDPANGGVFLITVNGTRPCGAVNLDTGDGSSITHACLIPATISHEYTRTGQFTVRATGQGNCDGAATTTVRVTSLGPQRTGSQRGAGDGRHRRTGPGERRTVLVYGDRHEAVRRGQSRHG